MKEQTMNNFNDIKQPYVQAFNRLMIVFNFNEQGNRDRAEFYLNQLTDKGRVFVGIVAADIKLHGLHTVKIKVRNLIDGVAA